MSKARSASKVRVVTAAGAVLYRMEDGVPCCAVVHRSRYDDWSLPKGKVDPGENLPETAAREILEETEENGCKLLGLKPGAFRLTDKIKDGKIVVSQGVIAGCAGGTDYNIAIAANIL